MKKHILIIFTIVSIFNNSISFSQDNPIVLGNARFTVITPELVRLEYALNGEFIDEPTLFAANRDIRSNDFKVIVKDNGWTHISTSQMRVEYYNDGFPFGQTNFRIFYKKGKEEKRFMIYQTNNKEQNLGGTIQTLDGKNGPVDLDNGLLSHDGWFIINDDFKPVLKNGWIENRSKESVMDRYFFAYDKDFKKALKALTAISGKVPLPRKYALGTWYCRWWDYSADEYRQILKEYKQHDFPLDVMVFDMGWHTQKNTTEGTGHAGNRGWTGYSWNKKLFPNPDQLIKEFKDDNIYVSLNDHPHDGIRTHETTYKAFMNSLGKTPKDPTPIFDAGDKTYMNAFFKYALKPNEDIGVDFWWLDWQQDYLYPFVRGIHGLTHLEWLNHLYYLHSQKNNKRGMHYSRWAGFGSHRYPIQFSGDYNGSWESLEYQIPFTVTSGNSACFFWAHDIGGFFGEPKEKAWELYARWTQFGLTNTSLRIHSVYDANLDRRPWLWGETAEKSMRIIYHMRSELMPYIYSTTWQAHNETLPVLRGMYLEFPNNEEAYKQEGQYFWGDAFLSAPITAPGLGKNKIAEKKVWLPKGIWYNFFDNKKYVGDQTIITKSDIYEFPLFAKGGIPIPMQPYTPRMTSSQLDHLIVKCYPGINGQSSSFELYEDDGISDDYIHGKKAITKLSYNRQSNSHTIVIHPTQGVYKGQLKKRSYQIELPATKKASLVTVNGKKVKFDYDQKENINKVQVSEKDIRSKITVVITAFE
ncbi:glycoside hydrolase family 31 protein [Aquimarina sp. 2201CG5-10]|uniref:glycoside hydrolase family 31 protein n=1 Tax=Aquimarina callyspongiae TaxID=3098150 RepID=UPI002AB38D8C|nr:TIM-barrel domain-containing protein [Aquimarina sp. 2201CG5-10]MDY8135627.1 glycoside hydrolase family 31 protein [Aquimarina sp. 2201CG5-10]